MRKFLFALIIFVFSVGIVHSQTITFGMNSPLGVRHTGNATPLYQGDIVVLDTNTIQLFPDSIIGTAFGDSSCGAISPAIAFPGTITVSTDDDSCGPGFLLFIQFYGNQTENKRDTIVIVGDRPYDAGVSLVNGFASKDTIALQCSGDSTYNTGLMYIDIDTVYAAGAMCDSLDSCRLRAMPLLSVQKGDSSALDVIGVVGPSLSDSIKYLEWGVVLSPHVNGSLRLPVNGGPTKIYPWTPLILGAQGLIPVTPILASSTDTVKSDFQFKSLWRAIEYDAAFDTVTVMNWKP